MSQLCLVADDSLYARMMLKNAICESMPKAEFQEASSGRQTLELAAAHQYAFDWYLLDVNMAPPDGLETARTLVSAGVPISRIALVTGNRSSHLLDDAGLMGICLINKAVSPDDVQGFVTRLSDFFAGQTAE